MVLEQYLEKYEQKEDSFSILSRYSKEVHDFRVKLLLLETEYRKFDTEVTAELKDLKAKVQGKEPEIEKLVQDIVLYTSSLKAVEKLIQNTVWLGNGLDEKGAMFMTLWEKLREKKQRDEEQAAKKIVKELADDANKPLDDFEEAGWTTVTSKRQRRRR